MSLVLFISIFIECIPKTLNSFVKKLTTRLFILFNYNLPSFYMFREILILFLYCQLIELYVYKKWFMNSPRIYRDTLSSPNTSWELFVAKPFCLPQTSILKHQQDNSIFRFRKRFLKLIHVFSTDTLQTISKILR